MTVSLQESLLVETMSQALFGYKLVYFEMACVD